MSINAPNCNIKSKFNGANVNTRHKSTMILNLEYADAHDHFNEEWLLIKEKFQYTTDNVQNLIELFPHHFYMWYKPDRIDADIILEGKLALGCLKYIDLWYKDYEKLAEHIEEYNSRGFSNLYPHFKFKTKQEFIVESMYGTK